MLKRLGHVFLWTGTLVVMLTGFVVFNDYFNGRGFPGPDIMLVIIFVLICYAIGYVLAGGKKDQSGGPNSPN